jgi:hypothetical protein
MDGRSLKCRHRLASPSHSDHSDSSALVAELRFNLPWSALRSRDGNTGASSTLLPAGKQRPRPLTLLSSDAKHTLKKGMARLRQELNSTSSDTEPPPSHYHHHSSSLSLNHNHNPEPNPGANDESEDDDDDDDASSDRLDLELARERLGGGRTGKSAKLGKLVVRDEGLKMADLLVAAAMAVWWHVYEGRV